MKNKLLLFLFLPGLLAAQTYDLLIKGGHIIDPANRIDGISDIAISGNKIARVAPVIDASQAKKTVDATGLYVTPGASSPFPRTCWLTIRVAPGGMYSLNGSIDQGK